MSKEWRAVREITMILTRRCPFRCGFCPQGFEKKDMSQRVLEAALRTFAGGVDRPARVKLFGGEPLARPQLVKKAVLMAGGLGSRPSLELATNGALLERGMAEFLASHPEVEVALSRPSPWARRLPNVSMNFVLPPGEAAPAALRRLREALSLGVRRFNFLPVYFIAWRAGELAELRRCFAGLRAFLKGLAAAGTRVEVKNLRRRGSLALYNDGLCVDTDGRIYASNLVLARGARAAAARLCLGDVRRPQSLGAPPAPRDFSMVLESCFAYRELEGTRLADEALTEFVHALA